MRERSLQVPDSRLRSILPSILVAFAMTAVAAPDLAASEWSDRVARYELFTSFSNLFDGGAVTPHWIDGGRRFWYVKGAGDAQTFVLVDARTGRRRSFFDEERLRHRLESSGIDMSARSLPFDTFELEGDASVASFAIGERSFRLDLRSYELSEVPRKPEANQGESLSPGGRWIVIEKGYDLWVRDSKTGEATRLTNDGEELYPWTVADVAWSNDGNRVALTRTDSRDVHRLPVVKWLPEQETVEWVSYSYARELDAVTAVYVVDLPDMRVIEIGKDDDTGEYQFLAGWRPDDSEMLFLRFGPGMRSLRLMGADPSTGVAHTIVRDEQKTFIEGLHFSISGSTFFHPLPDGNRFIWKSERDGWLHFYLYDYDGKLVRRLTEGRFEVNEVLDVDEKKGVVYFTGQADSSNPYDQHLYRVGLDGKGMVQLTASGETHDVSLSPDLRGFVDVHSAPSREPVSDLRRIDGSAVGVLEHADVSRLEAMNWKPPEEFVVKAADGETDLYGLLFKPHDFDPNKSYPVIEVIYAGSWSPVVPRRFGAGENATLAHALAQLNFVTFVVDARGTPGRGKAFQDVIYGQIGRYEIPDHVVTLRQLAAERPWMDLSRVGVHGKSWGGYFALRAMLQAPDVYHVGIASGIVSDLSTIAASPVAPYMGLAGENADGYARGSCLTMADQLKGRLLLTIASADVNTPFPQTMRMVEAFIKARKPVDLVVFPDQHHWLQGASMTYFHDVLRRYFVEHLHPSGAPTSNM